MRTYINHWTFILLCFASGWLLASCREVEGRGTFKGYRILKDGTKLAIVSDQYCPLSAVVLTPSVEREDQVRVKDWLKCSEMLDTFEEGGAPDVIRPASPDSVTN